MVSICPRARIDHARNIAWVKSRRVPARTGGIQINFAPRSEIEEGRFILRCLRGHPVRCARLFKARNRATTERDRQWDAINYDFAITQRCTSRFTFDAGRPSYYFDLSRLFLAVCVSYVEEERIQNPLRARIIRLLARPSKTARDGFRFSRELSKRGFGSPAIFKTQSDVRCLFWGSIPVRR